MLRTSVWILHQCQNVFQRTYWYNIGQTTCATRVTITNMHDGINVIVSTALYLFVVNLFLDLLYGSLYNKSAANRIAKVTSNNKAQSQAYQSELLYILGCVAFRHVVALFVYNETEHELLSLQTSNCNISIFRFHHRQQFCEYTPTRVIMLLYCDLWYLSWMLHNSPCVLLRPSLLRHTLYICRGVKQFVYRVQR